VGRFNTGSGRREDTRRATYVSGAPGALSLAGLSPPRGGLTAGAGHVKAPEQPVWHPLTLGTHGRPTRRARMGRASSPRAVCAAPPPRCCPTRRVASKTHRSWTHHTPTCGSGESSWTRCQWRGRLRSVSREVKAWWWSGRGVGDCGQWEGAECAALYGGGSGDGTRREVRWVRWRWRAGPPPLLLSPREKDPATNIPHRQFVSVDGWTGVSLTDLWARRNSLDFYRPTGPESGDSFPHGWREYHPLKKSLPNSTMS
jgi:hypothetical protein